LRRARLQHGPPVPNSSTAQTLDQSLHRPTGTPTTNLIGEKLRIQASTNKADWLVNDAERHRAGLRVGTAITEGTANFLVNRRMNKSQQMRWSRRGADLLLQVRCAVYNGTLGSGFGQKFQPANDPHPRAEIAA
jgi:hypothetical protein